MGCYSNVLFSALSVSLQGSSRLQISKQMAEKQNSQRYRRQKTATAQHRLTELQLLAVTLKTPSDTDQSPQEPKTETRAACTKLWYVIIPHRVFWQARMRANQPHKRFSSICTAVPSELCLLHFLLAA